jgi:hypothetical protein
MRREEEPTLQEIWDARQKIWEESGESFAGLLAYYQKAEQEHSHKVVRYEEDEYLVA